MAAIFLDTAGLLALVNKQDTLHAQAMAVMVGLAGARVRAVTTDWVLAEFLGGTAPRRLWSAAVRLTTELLRNPDVRVLPARRRDWTDAFALYRTRPDKDWSLVDCASIVVCRRLAIRRVFTRDHNFAQAGLEVLLA